MATKKYLIDAAAFYTRIANLQPEDRGKFVLKVSIDMMTDQCQEDFLEPAIERKKVTKTKHDGNYSDEFVAWWSLYPKRSGKGAAYSIWLTLMDRAANPKQLVDELMTALKWQVKQYDWTKERGKYVPMPTTYLNQRRWEDEDPNAGRERSGYRDADGIWHDN
jgi:hypothetical protein